MLDNSLLVWLKSTIKDHKVSSTARHYHEMLNAGANNWISLYEPFLATLCGKNQPEVDRNHQKMLWNWKISPRHYLEFMYIHIPFCRSKCNFCFFHTTTDLRYVSDYFSSLQSELNSYFKQSNHIKTINHFFIGGGTPSLIHTPELIRVLEYVYLNISPDSLKTRTLEVHPAVIQTDLNELIKNKFINRISIGVQSFIRKVASENHRYHVGGKDIISLCRKLKDAGVERINIDMMVGLKGQKISGALEDISQIDILVQENLIDSVTVYPCVCHTWSPSFGNCISDRHIAISPTSMLNRIQMQLIYQKYFQELNWFEKPICHYRKPEIDSYQNNGSVNQTEYTFAENDRIAFGNSAYSSFGRFSYKNVASVEEYMSAISQCGAACHEFYEYKDEELPRKAIIAGIKRGFIEMSILNKLSDREKQEVLELHEQFISLGWMGSSNERLWLTNLGRVFSDVVLARHVNLWK